MLSDDIAIATLQVRSSFSERFVLQQNITRQLQASDLTPGELPPSAILIVRALHDPMPGQLASRISQLRAPKQWEEAVSDTLSDLLRDAVRPGVSAIPESASAVLFADEAELVASLTLDLVRGHVGERWWWKRIGVAFPDLGPAMADSTTTADPAQVLLPRAQDMPAVFACLSQWRALGEVVASFDLRRTDELLQAMVIARQLDPVLIPPSTVSFEKGINTLAKSENTVWGAREFPSLASEELPCSTSADPQITAHTQGSIRPDVQGTPTNAGQLAAIDNTYRPEEPWAPWLAPGFGYRLLSARQRCLLGLALALHAAPMKVRQSDFARRAQAWWQYQDSVGNWSHRHDRDTAPLATDSGSGVESKSPVSPPVDIAVNGTEIRHDELSTVQSIGAPTLPDSNDSHRSVVEGTAIFEGQPASKATDAESSMPDQSPPATVATEQLANTAGDDDTCQATDIPGTRIDETLEGDTEPLSNNWPMFAGDLFYTRLGGILYLIHALEDLDLPMAFENEWELLTRIGPWGTLDLIVRALLRDRFAEVADDGIWDLLSGFVPKEEVTSKSKRPLVNVPELGSQHSKALCAWSPTLPDYRAPGQWRSKLIESAPTLYWNAAQGRLLLWVSSGYLIASVKRDKQHPLQQAFAESAEWLGHTTFELCHGDVEQIPLAYLSEQRYHENLHVWATAAAPVLAQRLSLALDLECNEETLQRLLGVEAEIYITNSHVDLVADIDQIWLPARRAGLDRNPGWLSDYGRVVLFHFRQ